MRLNTINTFKKCVQRLCWPQTGSETANELAAAKGSCEIASGIPYLASRCAGMRTWRLAMGASGAFVILYPIAFRPRAGLGPQQ
eukprot:12426997-Karenia_brevis.AAC.1